jgi:hypothetical protein
MLLEIHSRFCSELTTPKWFEVGLESNALEWREKVSSLLNPSSTLTSAEILARMKSYLLDLEDALIKYVFNSDLVKESWKLKRFEVFDFENGIYILPSFFLIFVPHILVYRRGEEGPHVCFICILNYLHASRHFPTISTCLNY